jgi:hypothetical protein
MHMRKNKKLWQLMGVISIAAAGCQSATQIPMARPSDTVMASRTACQKADAMWNEKIVPSRYEQLYALSSPGILDLLTLAPSGFSVKALTGEGDELEPGRRKLIHSFGAEARLRLVISPGFVGPYTGIFQSGSPCVIGRFSMASKPTADAAIPGLALKIFIDGDQPSVNLHLMHSVDSQPGRNFFAQTFSNILPPAEAFSTRVLSSFFERSAVRFGARDPSPGRLTLEHVASMQSDGHRIGAPKTPHQLLFKPTAQARALFDDTNVADDFRLRLAKLPAGQVLYDIYTLGEHEPADRAQLLGQLVLAQPVVSSRYGDETLYFQHNMAKK